MKTEHTTINRANKLLAKFIALANGVALAEGCKLDTSTAKGRTTLRLTQSALDGSERLLLHVEATVARPPEKAPRTKAEQAAFAFVSSSPAPPVEAPPVEAPPVAPELPEHLRDLALVATPETWSCVEDRGREPFIHADFNVEADARQHHMEATFIPGVRRALVMSPTGALVDGTFEQFPEPAMRPAGDPFADVAPSDESPAAHAAEDFARNALREAAEADAEPSTEAPAVDAPAVDAPKRSKASASKKPSKKGQKKPSKRGPR